MQLINDSNFKEVIASEKLVVIDFGASWCGPCKMLEPIVKELAAEYEGRAIIAKADVEDCTEVAEEYRILSVPTILFFKNGEVLNEKIVGLVSKQTLSSKIDALI